MMPAQPLEDFLTSEFIQEARRTLEDAGFITDEHDFAPYRETLVEHREAIQTALRTAGASIELEAGFLADHPKAGYAYFVFDAGRFENVKDASAAVSAWLDHRYAGDEQSDG